MLESIFILIALLAGYFFPFFKTKHIYILNKFLDISVISVIIIMSYNFSIFAKNNSVILDVFNLSLLYVVAIFVANIIALIFYCYKNGIIKEKYFCNKINNVKQNTSKFKMILESGKYLFYMIFGYLAGEILNINISIFLNEIITILLMFLLFIIGAQLKLERINLSQILKNKDAFVVTTILIISSIIPALLLPSFINIPYKESIMISSGFGWYSLSAVLNTSFLNEYYGISTFLIDFAREVIVISFIPVLRKWLSVEMVGYAANTAMDFSLPVIKNTYGNSIVPLAIGVGLILTIETPLLLIIENLIL